MNSTASIEEIEHKLGVATAGNILHPVYPKCSCEGCTARDWLASDRRQEIALLMTALKEAKKELDDNTVTCEGRKVSAAGLWKLMEPLQGRIVQLESSLRDATMRLAEVVLDMDAVLEYIEDGHEASATSQLKRAREKLVRPMGQKP